jgi:NAD(P)-dependent dehydrogenase (short-subunit alcohol dehydrogenase family)
MNTNTADRAVLVTGYSSGIGDSIARHFVEAGRQVIGVSRRDTTSALAGLADLAQRHGAPKPLAFSADVSELAALRNIAQRLDEEGLRVGTVVAAAGINVRKPAVEVTDEEVRAMVDVNLLGAFFTLQAFSEPVLREPGGRFIMVGSVSARQGMRLRAVYSATKAALGALARSISVEWAPAKATINCVAPGIIDTPLTSGYFDRNPGLRERVEESTPVGRVGTPADVTNVVAFLASEASGFITGETIATDGGFTTSNTWW